MVFLSVCRKVTDHPVSRFAPATPPKEGNGPPQIPLLRRGGAKRRGGLPDVFRNAGDCLSQQARAKSEPISINSWCLLGPCRW